MATKAVQTRCAEPQWGQQEPSSCLSAVEAFGPPVLAKAPPKGAGNDLKTVINELEAATPAPTSAQVDRRVMQFGRQMCDMMEMGTELDSTYLDDIAAERRKLLEKNLQELKELTDRANEAGMTNAFDKVMTGMVTFVSGWRAIAAGTADSLTCFALIAGAALIIDQAFSDRGKEWLIDAVAGDDKTLQQEWRQWLQVASVAAAVSSTGYVERHREEQEGLFHTILGLTQLVSRFVSASCEESVQWAKSKKTETEYRLEQNQRSSEAGLKRLPQHHSAVLETIKRMREVQENELQVGRSIVR
jgi:hypothetical protein